MRRFLPSLLVVCLCAPAALAAAEYDDCDANFIAFIGSSAYQFSPSHHGELGTVRLFSILSFQRAAHEGRHGTALWQLRIDRVEDGTRVLALDGRSFLGSDGAAIAELYWDGRDDAGRLVPAGRYHYTFVARYESRRLGGARMAETYDAAFDGEEALASSDEIVVDYGLPIAESERLRFTANATTCQVQQNTPMEAGFGYNFYYGSTHAHSNWSDGGQPTNACSSGNAYGSGTFTPANIYDYARNTAGLDFWVINEHNHLIQDAIATNNPPVTEAKVRQRYQDGIAAANSATVNGSFVGLYGMEWGVSTNSDQGHLTLIETPQLFGWESCSTCNGPSAECTPGTNCYFDVFTPKRFGYLALYAASVANPSSAGALGIFNHPSSGNFDNFAFNANADNAMQGIAVRSGLAFSTATDCATTNIASSDYTSRWKDALNRGFHLAPAADHDSHCNNYGMALPTRTVYLAPSLTKANIMAAQRARHFYASEDPNAQLVFRTGSGTQIMGDIFNSTGGATLVANLYDPDGESISTLEIWRGQIGGGIPASPYATYSNQSSVTLNETLTSGSYYYYVHAIQADGHDLWSAPMWITYQAGSDTQAPTTSITAPANGATVSGTVNVTANASDNFGVARVDFLLDGAVQSSDTTAPYAWSWNTTNASNAPHTLVSKAYDAANNVGTSATISVRVSNGASGSAANVGGWKVTQANAAGEYVIPANTIIPAEGYLVIARQADKAAFEAFWARKLATNVVFLNSGGAMPVINGDENYTLLNAALAVVDGPSASQPADGARTLQRTDPCAATWNTLLETSANPGSGAAGGCSGGVKLNEISDASGTNSFIYEFVELHNDSASAGDTQAPTTSITAPANAATVSGTTSVTANATDNVGVTKVEFWLDGALASTDTTSPYAWSWDTTTATNASHSLVSKAYDAANNVGTSSTVSVTVSNGTSGTEVNIGGYSLVQANSAQTYNIPVGTTIASQGYVIVGRNATKAQFEAFWGVTLAANVVYVNSGDTMPLINGSETYTLRNASATILDGPTVGMASGAGESLKRTNGCGAANNAASWSRTASSTGNPGTGAPAPCDKGVYISEFSDALGTGNFIYEFVELYNDK